MKPLLWASLFSLVGVAGVFLAAPGSKIEPPKHSFSAVPETGGSSHRRTALFFEQNRGQADDDARFIAHGPEYNLLLRRSKIVFQRNRHSGSGQEVSLSFPDANNHEIQGQDRLPGRVNYYVGSDSRRWYSGIPTFAKVRYPNVFPGIEALFYEGEHGAEFDFRVAPGSDPRQIRLKLSGPYSFTEGDLLLGEQGWMRIQKPRAYQVVDGREREVAANYRVEQSELGIELGEYDRTRALIIDPVVLYEGYAATGGSVAADSAGNAYLLGANLTLQGGGYACVVTKFGPTGTLIYQTSYGSVTSHMWCQAIAVDAQGDAYISGSTSGGIPITPGVVQPSYAGNNDAFAAKLTSSGQLAYGTYIGGSGQDQGYGIAIDPNGNAYVTGSTMSNDFPLVNAFQSTTSGQATFVTALNATASAFIYSTYLGFGTSGTSIGVDSAGDAYAAGAGAGGDFPLKNPLQTTCDSTCPYLAKFAPDGTSLIFSTYLSIEPAQSGGGPAMALDQSGNALVAEGGYDVVGFDDISPSGTLNFSNTISGPIEASVGVGVDAAGNLYVSAAGGLPFGEGPQVVASYTNSGAQIYSIQIPALGTMSVAGANAGNVYISGAPSDYATFYSVNMNQAPAGAFISKISAQDAPALGYTPPSPLAFGYVALGTSAQPQTLYLEDLGSSTLNLSFAVSGPGFAPVPGQSNCGPTLSPWTVTCMYTVTFTPQNTDPAIGAITITDNSMGSPHVIQLAGQGAVPTVGLNPSSLSFPDTVVGQSSQPQVVTFTDTGHEDLDISRISISSDFSETNTCGSDVFAGKSCTVSVIFTPTAPGPRPGTLTITDNAANSPQTVPLSGIGVTNGLNLQTQPGSFNSATVQAGQTGTYNLQMGGAGFGGTATLTCAGAPTGATCSLPSSIDVDGNTATLFKVSVSTTSRTMGQLHPASLKLRWLWATFWLAIILPTGSFRKKTRLFRAGMLPITLLLLLCSCGGSSSTAGSATNPNGTPAGTYQLTVTAKSGSTSQGMVLTLTVQ